MKKILGTALLSTVLAVSASGCASAAPTAAGEDAVVPSKGGRRVILFVWDGLRPDSVTTEDTPNLARMRAEGTWFEDHHSTYPTFTMMNAAAFATGSRAGKTGFYGNTFYQPGATGNDASGKPVDFAQPVYTEDYAILSGLNEFYGNDELLMVETLFDRAQQAGLKTAAIGKTGSAFLQDYKRKGIVLDEKTVMPKALASRLQANGYPLPKSAPRTYGEGEIVLSDTNGDPTAAGPKKAMVDGVTLDPTDASGSPYASANEYLMGAYLNEILPTDKPDLTVVWMRNPDTTQHNYGPGTANARQALRDNDALFGELEARLKALGMFESTDVLVVSDHAHSTVAGATEFFPLRAIVAGNVGAPDTKGYSTSGDVRLADLLTRKGFHAFDGTGCAYSPILSGVKADGTMVYPTRFDTDGSACGADYARADKAYTTGNFKVPATLPADAIVIAANGGSDYLYVPSHDADVVRRTVQFLQTRQEVGPIFIASRYGDLPGTMPLARIGAENASRSPDIIFSYAYDETTSVAGAPGIEYESMFNSRGMHGTFSPTDVHNTHLARGPSYRRGYVDNIPSANVDVAPTIARLLGLSLPEADGRPLLEALSASESSEKDYAVRTLIEQPKTRAEKVRVTLPTDPDGAASDPTRAMYTFQLHMKKVTTPTKEDFVYFDFAKEARR